MLITMLLILLFSWQGMADDHCVPHEDDYEYSRVVYKCQQGPTIEGLGSGDVFKGVQASGVVVGQGYFLSDVGEAYTDEEAARRREPFRGAPDSFGDTYFVGIERDLVTTKGRPLTEAEKTYIPKISIKGTMNLDEGFGKDGLGGIVEIKLPL